MCQGPGGAKKDPSRPLLPSLPGLTQLKEQRGRF